MKKKVILVVGGAGFIGSYVNKMLNEAGYRTVVLDNLSRGYKEAVFDGNFIKGDLADSALLNDIFHTYSIDAVMHFAAYIDVGESVKDPAKYYSNNVTNTLNLLSAMIRFEVKTLVFSSSAAIFGDPLEPLLKEEHPCLPTNPYGETKLMIEKIIRDFDTAYGLKCCCLRYFNAAGGDPEGKIKNYQRQTHNLIPRILLSIKKNGGLVTINGTDYPTRDGTCIRDYIHIADLAVAHIAAMEKLLADSSSDHYNLGCGQGFSIREVINIVEKVLCIKIQIIESGRRIGDPPQLIADASKAARILNWYPCFSLEDMIEHAWNGYSDLKS